MHAPSPCPGSPGELPEPGRLSDQDPPATGLLSPSQAAAVLGIDVKTLRRHVRLGNIAFVDVGLGRVRPRRRFARTHVATFIDEHGGRMAPPATCDIDKSAIRHAVRRRMAARAHASARRRP